jgi:hypothetical protein
MYRVDLAAATTAPELFRATQLKVPHNPADYEVKQVRECGRVVFAVCCIGCLPCMLHLPAPSATCKMLDDLHLLITFHSAPRSSHAAAGDDSTGCWLLSGCVQVFVSSKDGVQVPMFITHR